MTHDEGKRTAAAFPGQTSGQRNTGRLRRAKPVEAGCCPPRLDHRISKARAQPGSECTSTNFGRGFDPAHPHKIKILPLTKFACNETYVRENGGPLAEGDVRDRIGEPVHERRCRKGHALAAVLRAGLGASKPLRLEKRVGGGRIRARSERTEEFVECRHAPAKIGRRAQTEAAARIVNRANPSGRTPARAARILLVPNGCAGGKDP